MDERPIVRVLKKRGRMSRHGLITTLGDWFNVVGAVEFENALKDGIIIQSHDDPGLYVLNGLSEYPSKADLSTKISKTASTTGVRWSSEEEKDSRQT